LLTTVQILESDIGASARLISGFGGLLRLCHGHGEILREGFRESRLLVAVTEIV
jgi:hypothetical protein